MGFTEKDEAEARRNRKIAVALIIVAFSIDFGGWFVLSNVKTIETYAVDPTTGGSWGYEPSEPPWNATFYITFSATGSISESNPVHVHVTVADVNVTDFLSHYWAVGFTYGILAQYANTNTPFDAEIFLHDDHNGTYSGSGDVVWLQEGATYPFLWPNVENLEYIIPGLMNFTNFEHGIPATIINGESDTLSVQGSLNTQRLTWILIGFSVLMLQPVFQAIRFKIPHVPPPQEAKPVQFQTL